MLAPAISATQPTVLTLDSGLTVTNKTRFPIKIAELGKRGQYHHYRPYVDGKMLCPYKSTFVMDNLKYIASKTLKFSPVNDTYIKLTERDVVNPEAKAIRWIDTSEVMDKNYFFASNVKPEGLPCKPPKPVDEIELETAYWSDLLKGITPDEANGAPANLEAFTKAIYQRIDREPKLHLDHLSKAGTELTNALNEEGEEYFKICADLASLGIINLGEKKTEDLKRILNERPVSSLMFDCGGLIRAFERNIRALIELKGNVDTLIQFQKNRQPDQETTPSLLQATTAICTLQGAGFFAQEPSSTAS